MKWLVLGAISLYRRLPASFKRQCLFKETCSSFVGRVVRESGLWPGLCALRIRVSQCRPGYQVYFDCQTKSWHVRFKNGLVSNSSQLADVILDPYRDLPTNTWSMLPQENSSPGHAPKQRDPRCRLSSREGEPANDYRGPIDVNAQLNIF